MIAPSAQAVGLRSCGPAVVAVAVDPLGSELRALFGQLDHAGDLTDSGDPRQRLLGGAAGRVQHGTRVRFALRVQGTRILEARYRAYGCPYTLATCEWLARRLQGCELAALSPPALTEALGSAAEWAQSLAVPAVKLGRLLLIEDALQVALAIEHR